MRRTFSTAEVLPPHSYLIAPRGKVESGTKISADNRLNARLAAKPRLGGLAIVTQDCAGFATGTIAMAGHKSPKTPKVKDEKTNKRKRDVTEGGSRSKRHRSEQRDRKTNGHDRSANQDSRNGEVLEVGKSALNGTAEGESGKRQLEISRQFDDGEAGWKVSKPMGGRMLDIDPILTDDEQWVPSNPP